MSRPKKNNNAAFVRLRSDNAFGGGPWIATALGEVERALGGGVPGSGDVCVDLTAVTALDSAGALLLHQLRAQLGRQHRRMEIVGLGPGGSSLFELVSQHAPANRPPEAHRPGYLEELGRIGVGLFQQTIGFLSFVGQSSLVVAGLFGGPRKMRWRAFMQSLEAAGYRALPIVGLLAFLLGVVISYQGGVQLRQYGANVFIADLVGLSMLRELAPLITAVIVAGRTGSAFTAEIGTMKMNEEVDALRTFGIDPLEQLVLPKLLALVIALPLLTVYADIMGLLGGIVIANSVLGLSPGVFVERVAESVSLSSYLIGVGKAPVFAAIIAGIGCFQGFRVTDSAESVGRQTTVSVVQSIFLVIVVDAIFSVVFSKMDL